MRYFQLLKLGFFLFFTVLPAGIAFAHPHVWVTMETEVVLGPDKEITGFRHKWTFDEGYTSFAIDGLDTNGDGIYSEEELKPLAQTNIEALKEFEYFTFPFMGETKLPTKAPVDYRLDYKDKLLTLTFTLAAREAGRSRQDQGFQLRRLRPRHVCLAHIQRQNAGQDRIGKAGSVRRARRGPGCGEGES